MKESGCYAVAVGIESGSQKILDDMNKKIKIETIMEKTNILAKNKIKLTGLFIIGYPTETRNDILKTIEFAKKLPLERAAFTNFLALPGSKIYLELKEKYNLNNSGFTDMSCFRIIESFNANITKKELESLLKKAFWSFYLRPSIIFKTLVSAGTFSNLKNLLKRFFENYT